MALGLGMILERGARVHHDVVVAELQIAGLEVGEEMEGGIGGDAVEQVERRDLLAA